MSTVFQKCFPAWKQVFLPIFIVDSCASEQLAHVLYGERPTRILKLFLGGYSGSKYATLSSSVMHRAGAAHYGVLGGSPPVLSEQISAVMGHLLLEEGAGTSGKISWREKW